MFYFENKKKKIMDLNCFGEKEDFYHSGKY